MLNASEEDIRWLLFESGVSYYRIGKDTGIPEPNVYRLQKKRSKIENLRFNTASTLTAYARKVRQEQQTNTYEETNND